MHPIKGHLIILSTAALLAALLILTGCTERFTGSDEPEPALLQQSLRMAYDGPKFRHAALLERAVKPAAGKSGSASGLGLIIAVQPGVDKQACLERYRISQRWRIANRWEYNQVFDGFAWTIENANGSGNFQEVLDELHADPEILWYEPDFEVVMPNSNAAPSGSGQQVPWSVAAVGGKESWAVSGDGSGSVNVDLYILDTGIANAAPNDPDDDLTLVESIDFRDGYNDASDHDGHGTHVAGIAAAVDDNGGLVGVAPGARVHNYKVLNDDGKSDVSVVIAAVEHITAQKLASPGTPMVAT